MNKKKSIWIIFGIFLILTITASTYRYHIVNKKYSKYQINTIQVKPKETFNILNIEHELGETKITETIDEMNNKVTNYQIPIRFKNTTQNIVELHPEFYRMMREKRKMQTIEFINNKTNERIKSFKPNEEILSTVTFSYIEMNKKDKELPAFLYIITNDETKIQKYESRIY
ncbi:hypothetical protein ACPCZR_30310 [Bacillus bombysepticus]